MALVLTCAYSCRYSDDVILVYDGKDAQSPLIAQLCNRESFVQIISTGPDLYIQFKTGSAQPLYNGFKASYLFETNETSLHSLSAVTTSTISPVKIESIQIPQTGMDLLMICFNDVLINVFVVSQN